MENCTLEDSLTPAERALVDLGEHQRFRDTRMYFQYATEERFREVVERVTGREVRAFISGVDTLRDVASEIFHLVLRS
ncbi:MAG TPA: Na-translocating system protein MpsC family protein [Solirubrobacterales bacterium]|nr:Na-translocating system protein MpsC family protein [Solirubrobacterales bacterium]